MNIIVTSVCTNTFTTQTLLNTHMEENHNHFCATCKKPFNKKEDFENHIKENHTLKCNLCEFEGRSEDIMVDHILDRHAVPDNGRLFTCDDCSYQCESKEDFGKHYKDQHRTISEPEPETEETSKLKEELRQLKNNFERLETVFRDTLEEADQVKSDSKLSL